MTRTDDSDYLRRDVGRLGSLLDAGCTLGELQTALTLLMRDHGKHTLIHNAGHENVNLMPGRRSK